MRREINKWTNSQKFKEFKQAMKDKDEHKLELKVEDIYFDEPNFMELVNKINKSNSSIRIKYWKDLFLLTTMSEFAILQKITDIIVNFTISIKQKELEEKYEDCALIKNAILKIMNEYLFAQDELLMFNQKEMLTHIYVQSYKNIIITK
jgi:hypothetical protein